MENPLTNVPTIPLSLVSTTKVPNEFPTVDVPYRLAIIGEAPGADAPQRDNRSGEHLRK